MPGLFLSLDGIDGTGKSTQARLLADWLRTGGHTVTTCNDPGGTPIGDALRALVLDHRHDMTLPCEALVFMASRAELVARVIRPALDRGEIVVCDRFLLANVVYQGHAGGLSVDELWRAGRLSTGGLEPDLTLVLDLPIAAAAERRANERPDRVELRDPAYHERVRQGFLTEAKRRPDCIAVIDAAQSADAMQNEIRIRVEPLLQRLSPSIR
jgi:dTMP kinase